MYMKENIKNWRNTILLVSISEPDMYKLSETTMYVSVPHIDLFIDSTKDEENSFNCR